MDTRKMVTAEEARRVMDDITPTEWDASPVGQSERRAEDRRRAARLTEISTWNEARRWVGTVVALHEDVRRFAALLAAVTTERDEARAEVRRLTAALATARREARAEALRECFDIADGCATQRRATLARWDAEGVRDDDERRAWVGCKASEAERIRGAIRALRALPLDAPGGAT